MSPERGGAPAPAASEGLRATELRRLARRLPERIDARQDNVERGLAQLVLTLIEFLRRVLEQQAVRRMEGGSLTEEEVERLGLTLMKLAERTEELKATFGLEDEDLTLDLGPLSSLL